MRLGVRRGGGTTACLRSDPGVGNHFIFFKIWNPGSSIKCACACCFGTTHPVAPKQQARARLMVTSVTVIAIRHVFADGRRRRLLCYCSYILDLFEALLEVRERQKSRNIIVPVSGIFRMVFAIHFQRHLLDCRLRSQIGGSCSTLREGACSVLSASPRLLWL